jgi:hypothetical protein
VRQQTGQQIAQRAGHTLLQARRLRPVPLADDPERSLTCLVRLPPALAAKVHDVVRDLPGAGAHYVYPAETLHVTVLNLRELEGAADGLGVVADVLAGTAPFPLVLDGFGVTSHSVYVRALDPTGALVGLRRRLLAVTGAAPPWPLRRLAFVNVVRYRSPDAAVLAKAARRTTLRLGDFQVAYADVVRTDRVFAPDSTTWVDRLPLNGRNGHDGLSGRR